MTDHLTCEICDMQERYEAVYGPNSKQMWIYDNVEDVFIDPPAALLDEIDSMALDADEAEAMLLEAALSEACRPDGGWLCEREFWWDGDI